MADKTLKTRIKLKYDTLANWQGDGASVVLLKGEVAICEVPTGGSLEQVTPPAILFKVGDGVKTFAQLPWVSGLAADVYAWAKAATKPTYTASEVGAAPTTHNHTTSQITDFTNVVNGLIDTKIAEIPSVKVPEYTLETGTDEGSIVLKKDGAVVGDDVIIQGYSALKASIAAKYTKPEGGIPKTDLASDVQASLGKADTALQSAPVTSVNGATGAVVLDKGDIGLGSVENKALDTAVKASSGNYITSGAVKSYVDSAISGITEFDIQTANSFGELPKTGVKGTIYLVPDEHSDSNDTYDEYIWVTDKYEKIGNTDVNLSGYVPTSRTIAGLALTGNISSASLAGAIKADLNIPAAITESTVSGWGFTKNAGTVTSVRLGATTITSSGDLTSATNTLITTAIGGLDVTDTAVSNQYVSAVSETDGKIKVTRATLPSANNGKLLDAAGNEIFTANQSDNSTIIVIDCGTSTELVD